ncbi:hypothetical protein ACFL5V_11880 [Fibrobacterota bacterium]
MDIRTGNKNRLLSGFYRKSVIFEPDLAVTFDRIQRSFSAGSGGHFEPDRAVKFNRIG